jgi:glycerol-3-phosphate cytidylyltransferase
MIPAARYTTLLTYGVFDTMSVTDITLLRQLSNMGQELIVGCATDAFCDHAGTPCLMPFAQRRRLLERNRYVSRVIAQDCWDQVRTDIVNYNVSALALADRPETCLKHLQDIAQVLYLPQKTAATPALQALAS